MQIMIVVMRFSLGLMAGLLVATACAQESGPARSDWAHHGGSEFAWRYSALDQINTANVKNLAAAWTFQTGDYGDSLQSTPIVIDGVMYVSTSYAQVFALDAATGRVIWHYKYPLRANAGKSGGEFFRINRGLAVSDGKVFLGTPDSYLVAIDQKSGRELWRVNVDDASQCGCSITSAPLVVKDKVVVGGSGGDNAHRGYLTAFYANTGRLAWRWYVIPGPGEKGHETWKGDSWKIGGGSPWLTGSFDPELNMLYWGTGNAAGDFYPGDRNVATKGEVNLYTASVVALDPDTGKLRWHFQFTPHDEHDWDSNQIEILADLTIGGRVRKTLITANRNGFFYVLDRANGKLLQAKPFTDTNWAREIGADGRPIVLEETGVNKCLPDFWGGTNFMPPSFDPALNLFFVTARETCVTYFGVKPQLTPGQPSVGGGVRRVADRIFDYGALRAIDASTGERKWEVRYTTPSLAGVMSTASGLVFAGDNEGNFMAVDAKTGKPLWHYPTGASIWGAAATTFMLDGRQYVLIPSGTTLVAFALPQ